MIRTVYILAMGLTLFVYGGIAGAETAYKTLGVLPSASNSEIKRAYQLSVRELNVTETMQGPTFESRQEELKALNDAYNQIKTEERRRAYDKSHGIDRPHFDMPQSPNPETLDKLFSDPRGLWHVSRISYLLETNLYHILTGEFEDSRWPVQGRESDPFVAIFNILDGFNKNTLPTAKEDLINIERFQFAFKQLGSIFSQSLVPRLKLFRKLIPYLLIPTSYRPKGTPETIFREVLLNIEPTEKNRELFLSVYTLALFEGVHAGSLADYYWEIESHTIMEQMQYGGQRFEFTQRRGVWGFSDFLAQVADFYLEFPAQAVGFDQTEVAKAGSKLLNLLDRYRNSKNLETLGKVWRKSTNLEVKEKALMALQLYEFHSDKELQGRAKKIIEEGQPPSFVQRCLMRMSAIISPKSKSLQLLK